VGIHGREKEARISGPTAAGSAVNGLLPPRDSDQLRMLELVELGYHLLHENGQL